MTDSARYLNRPYHFLLVHDRADDGTEGWVSVVEEIPSVFGQGETPDDAVQSARYAFENWLDGALAAGMTIPEPRAEDEYSGRFLVRLPRSLHMTLADAARQEGISLNQFVAAALAGAVQWRRPRGGRASN
ncbi:MAG TPA: type II toxin-antitoxin system HicB family antitoxin [Chloroflexota bacterium]|nr:type II toxin-antitoxin system HicB family antitoxin [Chloroflexota bacterium]